MNLAAVRSRVGIEAKADKQLLDKLFREMSTCKGQDHPERAIEVLQPRLFLGVAAAETWQLLRVEQRDRRAA